MSPYTKTVKCTSCKGKGIIFAGQKNEMECTCCEGTKKIKINVPHPSHSMSKKKTEIRSPNGGESRFYSVRHCEKCGDEELQCAAGHFLNRLQYVCQLPTAAFAKAN